MKYRLDKNGRPLSQLGYGCMRFSKKGASIDHAKAEREVLRGIELGINYFDTAYIYPGSEDCLGRILAENRCRDQVSIATKLPQYMIRSAKAIDKTFREELSRLRTDRIDYYLMHMFTDYAEWEKLQSLGIEQWIAERKAEGSVGSIGFSYHGDSEMFLRLLEAYDWDFCQIQYNYLDEHSQAGRRGLQAAAHKGIPVIVMEPLRGGKLVRLPAAAKQELAASGRGYSPAELGLRWLWDQPEVTCVLSGMNSLEMVEENARIAGEAEPGCLTEADRELVARIRTLIREKEKVGCTGCRYCMPCPKGVDIPGNFYYYNLMYIDKKTSARFEFAQTMGLRREPGFASQCIGCGKCEQHCPQGLPIRELLREADRKLRPLPYRLGIDAARRFMIR
ncbi:MAG: aldo/keto reductase [Firmicutes bacterium]|nr:aldo/keto reductase [Bacillota bacterium]